MASVISFPCEEQLQCSICLDRFTEPVSTPCGHNYCKHCITGYWDSSAPIQCPLCKKRFRKRPQLQVNTEFRDMLKHFHRVSVNGDDEIAKPGEVPCDICIDLKLKAKKTCVVCLASYCQPHLEPHQRVKTLKKHQLIEPVSNLEDRVCKTHDKMLEFFCNVDQKCVCVMCLKDNHVSHWAVPLEQAFRDKKGQLNNVKSEIQIIENTTSRKIQQMKYFVERTKKESEKELAHIAEEFNALLVALQRSQAELVERIQKKQKAAQKEVEDAVTELEQEVSVLRRRKAECDELLQTEDKLSFLQSFSSLCIYKTLFQSNMQIDLSDFSQQSYVGMVKNAVSKMESILSHQMEMIRHGVSLSDDCATSEEFRKDDFDEEVWNPPKDKLMMIQQNDAVDVTLDAYTAYYKLIVSEDGKQLRFAQSLLPSDPIFIQRRFQYSPCIIATEGFSSGRFYYEVQVSGTGCWVLGVVKKSIGKLITGFPQPEQGGWTFLKLNTTNSQIHEEYFPHTCSHSPLSLKQRPQKVGVFVDYEKGEVSFYDVDARTLIYSYSECAFIETPSALKSFLYYIAGMSLSNRPKLYPFFGVFSNEESSDTMLVISPVAHAI
ncbi:E3 ubiquitin-protein ligase TRIM39-like [Eleginops maclovinus]|uniref:E3 ubiquitin-protein ligase TRIM39-like n=1 Tax=Eleginops maclovinus TaxID=56733 RepID=UPI0030810623